MESKQRSLQLNHPVQCTEPPEAHYVGGSHQTVMEAGNQTTSINWEVQNLYDMFSKATAQNEQKDAQIAQLNCELLGLQQQVQDLQQQLAGQRINRDFPSLIDRSAEGLEPGASIPNPCTGQWSTAAEQATSPTSPGSCSVNFASQDMRQSLSLMVTDLHMQLKTMESLYNEAKASKEETQAKYLQLSRALNAHKEEEKRLAREREQIVREKDELHRDFVFLGELYTQEQMMTRKLREENKNKERMLAILREEPAVRPVKRGRFEVVTKPSIECINCRMSFKSEDEFTSSTCRYHKAAKPVVIKSENEPTGHPCEKPSPIWPCCRQVGKFALGCQVDHHYRKNNFG